MKIDLESAANATGLAPLFSVAQVRAVEAAALANVAPHVLMQRAAAAAADRALRLLSEAVGTSGPARVLVAAGIGNNGGDALECAALLVRHGCRVAVLMPVAPSARSAPSAPAGDHALALAGLRALGDAVELVAGTASLAALAARDWDLVIDGLFGIGLSRALGEPWSAVVEALNGIPAPLLALDVPSGLDADSGNVLTSRGVETVPGAPCIRASHTITFIADKTGLHTGSGREFAGEVTVAALDIEATLLPPPVAWRNGPPAFTALLASRRQDTHKGSFGDVHVIGGAAGMSGAAILAAQAALKSGCGRVSIGFAQDDGAPAFIPGQPEIMCRTAVGLSGRTHSRSTVVVIGPGLGQDAAALALLHVACDGATPLVIDADGLTLLASAPALASALAARAAPVVLTPHPLEAARLLGGSVGDVQADRLQAAAELARRYRAVVVLKGSGTVIAHQGCLLVNPTGNAALATGGTGDVLAGLCGALLAQGCTPLAAAAGAVWLHGAAADWLVQQGVGPVGVTAGEIIDAARTVRNRMVATCDGRRRHGAGAGT